jgi:hypothetical protein
MNYYEAYLAAKGGKRVKKTGTSEIAIVSSLGNFEFEGTSIYVTPTPSNLDAKWEELDGPRTVSGVEAISLLLSGKKLKFGDEYIYLDFKENVIFATTMGAVYRIQNFDLVCEYQIV